MEVHRKSVILLIEAELSIACGATSADVLSSSILSRLYTIRVLSCNVCMMSYFHTSISGVGTSKLFILLLLCLVCLTLADLSIERHHSTLVVLALNVCFVLTFHFGTHLFRRFECSIDVTTSRLVTQFVLCIDVSINSATISIHSTCFLIVSVVHLHIVLIVLL